MCLEIENLLLLFKSFSRFLDKIVYTKGLTSKKGSKINFLHFRATKMSICHVTLDLYSEKLFSLKGSVRLLVRCPFVWANNLCQTDVRKTYGSQHLIFYINLIRSTVQWPKLQIAFLPDEYTIQDSVRTLIYQKGITKYKVESEIDSFYIDNYFLQQVILTATIIITIYLIW